MTVSVPKRPPLVPVSGTDARVRAALPVIGTGQWTTRAQSIGWLLGRGAQLITRGPDMTSDSSVAITAGSTREYRFWVWSKTQYEHRTWMVSLANTSALPAFGIVETNENNAGYVTIGNWSIPGENPTRQPVEFEFPQIVSGSSSGHEVAIRFTNNLISATSVFVTGIYCVETPLPFISAISGQTIPDDGSVLTRQPIYAATDNTKSVDATYRASSTAINQSRRATLFNWASPTTITSTATTFTGTSNVFTIDFPVLGRKIYTGEVLRAISFAALCRGVSGVGEIRLTASSGDSATVAIPDNAQLQWVTGEFDADCDDVDQYDTDGGLQGGAEDTITVEIRRTTASSVILASLNLTESAITL